VRNHQNTVETIGEEARYQMLEKLRKDVLKFDQFCQYLETMNRMTIAFSGGVDSAFLLRIASLLLKDQVMAVTVESPYIANWEIDEAKAFTEKYGITHHFIQNGIPEVIMDNPQDRCYLCKTLIFGKIIEFANEKGYTIVADGSNADDTKDYRPGMRALKELHVKSPLLEMGITKAEIREWSKALNLETWDKPAYACLLTRLPYNEKIEISSLTMIEKAETFLIHRGVRAVRVRKHQNLARIEVTNEYIHHFFDVNFMHEVADYLKTLGFEQVTLDLAGYQMGSFNKGVTENEN